MRNGKRNARRPGRSHLAGGLVRRALPLKRQQRRPHAETRRTRRKDWVRNGKRNARRPGRSHLAGGLVRRVLPLKRQQQQPHAETRRTRRETKALCFSKTQEVLLCVLPGTATAVPWRAAFSAVKLFYSGRNDAKERAMRKSVLCPPKSSPEIPRNPPEIHSPKSPVLRSPNSHLMVLWLLPCSFAFPVLVGDPWTTCEASQVRTR